MKTLSTSLLGFLLATAGQAGAAVFYSGVQNILIPTNFDGVYLDIVPASTDPGTGASGAADPSGDSFTVVYSEPTEWDVNFFFGGMGIAHGPDFNPYRSNASDSLSPVHNLGVNTVIDGSTASGPVSLPSAGSNPLTAAAFGGSGDASGNAATNHVGINNFQFINGTEGYVAFVLDDEGTTYNGWMRVTLNDNGNAGTIHDWAYDTNPIEIGAIPESSYSVLLVAGGFLAFRRRRSEPA